MGVQFTEHFVNLRLLAKSHEADIFSKFRKAFNLGIELEFSMLVFCQSYLDGNRFDHNVYTHGLGHKPYGEKYTKHGLPHKKIKKGRN